MGLAVGLAAGVTLGLLAAPMRGSAMRASLRSRADGALDRGLNLLDEGRRAFNRSRPSEAAPVPLTATLGEMAQTHPGTEPLSSEAQS
ncbi:MAG TPA: YtxH domain-containing protein [Vicinamibacterales bacterium]|nr:YtxH domain-containing protein [Vicinamibacterales bacterium]